MHIFDILYDFSGTYAFLMAKIPVQTWKNVNVTCYYYLWLVIIIICVESMQTWISKTANGYTNIIYITLKYQWMHNMKSA